MSGNRVTFDGVEELKKLLREFPEDLTAEGQRIAEATANGMASTVKREYHRGPTGNLIEGVYVTHFERGRFIAGAQVVNAAKHAYIYDHGTEARHYYESSGKEHATGAMWSKSAPPFTFIRAALRARQRMWSELRDMVERHGFIVRKAA